MKPKRDVEIWDCYMLPFPFSAVSLCLKNTTLDVWENLYEFLQKTFIFVLYYDLYLVYIYDLLLHFISAFVYSLNQ